MSCDLALPPSPMSRRSLQSRDHQACPGVSWDVLWPTSTTKFYVQEVPSVPGSPGRMSWDVLWPSFTTKSNVQEVPSVPRSLGLSWDVLPSPTCMSKRFLQSWDHRDGLGMSWDVLLSPTPKSHVQEVPSILGSSGLSWDVLGCQPPCMFELLYALDCSSI